MTVDEEHRVEADPSSSAAIHHTGGESGALREPLLQLFPWLLISTLAAVTAAAFMVTGSAPLAAACAVVAGGGGAKAIVKRLRRVVLRSDRLIESGLASSTELRLAKIEAIEIGALPTEQTVMAVSPSSLIYRGEAGSIAFDTLEASGAARMSQAVFAVVGPRLVQKMAAALRAGRPVHFGRDVSADRFGFHVATHKASIRLAWDAVERVEVSPGGVRIFAIDRPDSTVVVPLDADNAVLLGDLVDEMRSGSTAVVVGDVAVEGWDARHAEGGALVCGLAKPSSLTSGILAASSAALATVGVLSSTVEAQVLAGTAALTFGILTIGTFVEARSRGFAVYERGVAKGRRFLAFDDVAHLQRMIVDQYGRGGFARRRVMLVLTDHKGRKLKFSGTGDEAEAVVAAAVRRALPRLVEAAKHEISHGKAFMAGNVSLDKVGVGVGSERLLWDDLDRAVVVGTTLQLFRRGEDEPVIFMALGTPDALVAQEIVEHRLATQRELAPHSERDLFRADDVAVEVAVEVESILKR